MLQIATHSGAFHADDAFAVAVLQSVLTDETLVVRTRAPDVIARSHYVVDVGGAYHPGLGRFDHHQQGYSERRPNGTPYAAAGLVWRHYGQLFVAGARRLVGRSALTVEQQNEVVRRIDETLVQPIDALDTGYRPPADLPASLPLTIEAFNATREELQGRDKAECDVLQDARFGEAVAYMDKALRSFVSQVTAEVLAADLVRQSEQLADGRIVVLTVPGLPWYEVVCKEMPKARFVVYPDSSDAQYHVHVVPIAPDSFTARQDLLQVWAGLRDEALAEVTGVPDAVFCHNGLFIAGAHSKQGAIALATAAL